MLLPDIIENFVPDDILNLEFEFGVNMVAFGNDLFFPKTSSSLRILFRGDLREPNFLGRFALIKNLLDF